MSNNNKSIKDALRRAVAKSIPPEEKNRSKDADLNDRLSNIFEHRKVAERQQVAREADLRLSIIRQQNKAREIEMLRFELLRDAFYSKTLAQGEFEELMNFDILIDKNPLLKRLLAKETQYRYLKYKKSVFEKIKKVNLSRYHELRNKFLGGGLAKNQLEILWRYQGYLEKDPKLRDKLKRILMREKEVIPTVAKSTLDTKSYVERIICPICGGDGGAAGQCFKCDGTGWYSKN